MQCKLYKNGNCDKWMTKHKCTPSCREWLDETVSIIPIDRMCENSSIFGNVYVKLTKDDLERILKGDVALIEAEEYNVFIGYVEEDNFE